MKWLVKKPVEAMAIINPRFCEHLHIQAEIEQSREGPIPHVHVYMDKTRNPKKCAYVRLDKAEYSPHHSKTVLDKNAKREFISLMNSIHPRELAISVTNPENVHRASGYEQAVYTWMDSYPGSEKFFAFDQDGFPVMPNYENL